MKPLAQISISLDERQWRPLQTLATRWQMPVEQLVKAVVEEWLARQAAEDSSAETFAALLAPHLPPAAVHEPFDWEEGSEEEEEAFWQAAALESWVRDEAEGDTAESDPAEETAPCPSNPAT